MDYRALLICATPRSGTTLLAESMAQCFDIDAVEPHEAKLRSRRPGSRIYLTKMPDDIKIVVMGGETQGAFKMISGRFARGGPGTTAKNDPVGLIDKWR